FSPTLRFAPKTLTKPRLWKHANVLKKPCATPRTRQTSQWSKPNWPCLRLRQLPRARLVAVALPDLTLQRLAAQAARCPSVNNAHPQVGIVVWGRGACCRQPDCNLPPGMTFALRNPNFSNITIKQSCRTFNLSKRLSFSPTPTIS